MSFEQVIILEFIGFFKWVGVCGIAVILLGRTFRNVIDYLIKELETKQ
jgi:hypothetical protein